VQSAALVLGCVNHTFSRISLRYPWSEVNEGPELEKQRPPRWDSYPLGGVTPDGDARVRYWPEVVLLVSVVVLFVALSIAIGFPGGPLVTGAVVASYPILLILAPIRKSLVPREVGISPSTVPLRVWVLGWLLVAAGTACQPLILNGDPPGQLRTLVATVFVDGIVVVLGMYCVIRAPRWEQAPRWVQWRNRPRKKGRKSPQNGDSAPTGAATLGQPH
jgi:hypothetical protein